MEYSSASVGKGVEQDDLVMPVINFQGFLTGDSKARAEVGAAILKAFKTSGFLYLSNHGVSESMIQQAFDHSAKFFARPQIQKDQLAWTNAKQNRGYLASGREKLTNIGVESAKERNANPDLKETMEIGWDGIASKPNKWPEHFDEDGAAFAKFMREFFDTMQDLNQNFMQAVALGMGLDEDFFHGYIDAKDNNMRLLHYPPVKKSIFKENNGLMRVRAGEHSDYGSITLLLQDSTGGLEVKSPKNTWVGATPIPGTIVVNAGDLLSRWSNDEIKSTKHRVIQPPPKPDERDDDDPDATLPDRYSIAYFCIPNFNAYIDALPGTWELTEIGKKYPGVLSGEYQLQRLAETF
ncbi:hypothetical protein DV737_g1182, partial [Chaetothyriales sp. CBS 132003]